MVDFSFVSRATDAGHSIGKTPDGSVYTWGTHNQLGALGRKGKPKVPTLLPHLSARLVAAGGHADAGHTVIVDTNHQLWVTGCDRWQQLGLGSAKGGAAGYTWGAVFRNGLVRNDFVTTYLQELDPSATIRDVAVGGDHTVVLSSNQRDVVTFGKGAEGQLGLNEKRFVSAPMRSPILSKGTVSAVCAIQDCSLTLSEQGNVLNQTGKCRRTLESFKSALQVCKDQARQKGLLPSEETR